MTKGLLFSIISLTILCSSCDSSSNESLTTFVPADTTNSFKIENFWLTPKKSFELNVVKYSVDTLTLVTCSEYVYFPFGKLTNKLSIETSLLKDFNVVEIQRDTFTNTNLNPPVFQWTEFLKLRLDDDSLNIILDNDPEASKHGYIQKGTITSDKVVFTNKIKIGMAAVNFYSLFFDKFPIELRKKIKTIQLESCVTDIIHIYNFDDGQLISVTFVGQ